jgi:uncharacterized protein (DUF488 family)
MATVISEATTTVLTIGHSTRTLEVFTDLLEKYSVKRVLDVRTVPRSRRNPQFNRETLPESLRALGIGYTHMPGLGGLRRPRPDSPNTGWRTPGFRGFADYASGAEFEQSLQALLDLARQTRLALMCAEAVPWRCHRSLIADALVVRGVRVEHILSPTSCHVHSLTSFARVEGTRITYPPETIPITFEDRTSDAGS